MIAIILAGGYARRLWPLTLDRPKPLLPVAGKPIIDHIIDRLQPLAPKTRKRLVLTNRRFDRDFKEWAEKTPHAGIEIVHDGSSSEDDKPGAVGALAAITNEIKDDLLVLAGDCLFLDDLSGLVALFEEKRAPVVAVYRPKDKEQLVRGSAVTLDPLGVITSFIEKPREAISGLVGAAMYVFPMEVRERLREYVRLGLPRDEPGRFIEWLHKKERVYGYVLEHPIWDIGTPEAYALAEIYLQGLR